MVTQKEQTQMMDYLVSNLQESYEIVTPRKSILNEDVNGILLHHDSGHCYGLIVLLDKEYPNNEFDRIYTKLRREASRTDINMGLVIYKDGETFFRSAAPHCYHYDAHIKESVKNKSLKLYTNEDIHRMIMFRPEEIFAFKHHGNVLQYYQPESPRLEEGLMTYDFKTVQPDYSHRDPEFFQPHIDTYKRDHIWRKSEFYNGNLFLEGRLLEPKKDWSKTE